MLLDIKCKAISSIQVHLTFDDTTVKDEVIALGDLVNVEYNGNGMRKRIVGIVSNISTVGTDPKNWYIIVDGSDDFAKNSARFAPTSILDIEIIRKAGMDNAVLTPIGEEGCPYIRVVRGQFQYSKDGKVWHRIRIYEEDIIEPQEGTVPIGPGPKPPVPPCPPPPHPHGDDDGIEDAVY